MVFLIVILVSEGVEQVLKDCVSGGSVAVMPLPPSRVLRGLEVELVDAV